MHEIAFVDSKGRGGSNILSLADESLGVKTARPSLVFGKGRTSTKMFIKMAKLPVWVLPDGGNLAMTPVHVDDVAQGLVNLATQDFQPVIINFTGGKKTNFADYLTTLRKNILGKPLAKILSLSMSFAKFSASILQNLSDMVSVDSLILLEQGNVADNQDFAKVLGREPLSYQQFNSLGIPD